MIRPLLAIPLIFLLLPWACGPPPGGDDDDDDTAVGDDDSAQPDDDDDDDTTDLKGCGADVDDALVGIASWDVVSCGDIHIAAADAGETVSISLNVFVDTDDYQVGDVFEAELIWPAGFLWLETGEDLLGYDSTDVLVEERVDRRWEALFGTVRVTMLEVGSGTDTVQVELRDVLVVDPEDWTSGCEIPAVTWTDLRVGWLAGGG